MSVPAKLFDALAPVVVDLVDFDAALVSCVVVCEVHDLSDPEGGRTVLLRSAAADGEGLYPWQTMGLLRYAMQPAEADDE